MPNYTASSLSFFPKGSRKPPYLLRLAVKIAETGDVPFWLKVLIKMRFGKFITPGGVEYSGFKVEFKW